MRTARLSDVAKLDYGFAFDSKRFNKEGRGLPLVRIRDVVPGRSDTYYSGEYTDRYLVEDGDFLIGMDGQFNLACWQGGKALLNQRVCRIGALDDSLDRAYLARFMPAALKAIEDSTPFVTVKHLSAGVLGGVRVPLPPYPSSAASPRSSTTPTPSAPSAAKSSPTSTPSPSRSSTKCSATRLRTRQWATSPKSRVAFRCRLSAAHSQLKCPISELRMHTGAGWT